MTPHLTRRRLLLNATAATVSAALPALARAEPVAMRAEPVAARAPEAITVTARPLTAFDTRDAAHRRFGDLSFRSGVILTSPHRDFGGLSALRLDATGERIVALSDRGRWFTGRIVYGGDAMTGLADVQTAAILGDDGKPLLARGWVSPRAPTPSRPKSNFTI